MSLEPEQGRVEGRILFPTSTSDYPALRVAFVDNAPDYWCSTLREATEINYLPISEDIGQDGLLKTLLTTVSRLEAKQIDQEKEIVELKQQISHLQEHNIEQADMILRIESRLEKQMIGFREFGEFVDNERIKNTQNWQSLWVDVDNFAIRQNAELEQVKNRIDDFEMRNLTAERQRHRISNHGEDLEELKQDYQNLRTDLNELKESLPSNVHTNWEKKIEKEVSALKCTMDGRTKMVLARIDSTENTLVTHTQQIQELRNDTKNIDHKNQEKKGEEADRPKLRDRILQIEIEIPKLQQAITAQNERARNDKNENDGRIGLILKEFRSEKTKLNSEIVQLKSKLEGESMGNNCDSESKSSSRKSWKFWNFKSSASKDLKSQTDQLETSFGCMDEAVKSQDKMMRAIKLQIEEIKTNMKSQQQSTLKQIDQIKTEVKSQEKNLAKTQDISQNLRNKTDYLFENLANNTRWRTIQEQIIQEQIDQIKTEIKSPKINTDITEWRQIIQEQIDQSRMEIKSQEKNLAKTQDIVQNVRYKTDYLFENLANNTGWWTNQERIIQEQIDQIRMEIKSQGNNLATTQDIIQKVSDKTMPSKTSRPSTSTKSDNASETVDGANRGLINDSPKNDPPSTKKSESQTLDWRKRTYLRVSVINNQSGPKREETTQTTTEQNSPKSTKEVEDFPQNISAQDM